MSKFVIKQKRQGNGTMPHDVIFLIKCFKTKKKKARKDPLITLKIT